MNYDIIGDIHGHADALKALLSDLGYRERESVWRHPDRQAIFLGDFIDRGPKVVHACWHPRYMDYLASHLSADRRLDAQLMVHACREPEDEREKDSPEPTIFKAVEALVKGVEIPLPPPHTFKDKDGHERSRVRVRWWDTEAVTYSQAAMLPDEERQALPDLPIPEHARLGHDEQKPLFVGHYWLQGTPRPLSDKVVCVDYSIGKGGKLVAYRWDGESVLDASKFHWVGA